MHIISLGAGVQSSCMSLMAAAGELTPMPTCAIFSDTQGEPESVYRWLGWLEKQLPFPVYRVTAGSLEKAALVMNVTADGRKYSRTSIPFWTKSANGDLGRIQHRSCTSDFKLKPLFKKAKEIAKVKRGEKNVRVIQWIGISLDEATRMKPSREPWAQSRWPLIEAGKRRSDCLAWMQRHGFPEPPRSACGYCPFHNNAEWRRLKNDEPAAFERAVQFERMVQETKKNSDNFDSTPFLHRSCVPLDQIDFSNAEDRGQINLFENECEGICST